MRVRFVAAAALLVAGLPGVAGAQSAQPSAPAASPSPASPTASSTTVTTGATTSASAPASQHATVQVEPVTETGTPVRGARMSTEFNAPFDVTARVVTDFSQYNQFLPQVRESRVVQRRRGGQDVYFHVPMLDGFPPVWSLVRFNVTRTPTSVVVDGAQVNGNMNRFEIHIEASAIPGTNRSRVSMHMLGIPAFPLPTGFLSTQQSRWGQRGMVALRDRTERAAALAALQPGRPSGRPVAPSATTQRPPSSGGGPGSPRN